MGVHMKQLLRLVSAVLSTDLDKTSLCVILQGWALDTAVPFSAIWVSGKGVEVWNSLR